MLPAGFTRPKPVLLIGFALQRPAMLFENRFEFTTLL
jgi:hypothetical protein